MRVSNVALNTDYRDIHPGYLDYLPKQPRRRPKEQPFTFPEYPKKSPLDELRSKLPEISTYQLEILHRICAFGLILIGLFMIGQLSYEFFNQPPPPRPLRVATPQITPPTPKVNFDEIEKKFEAIASVLEYLVNQQRLAASTPLPPAPSAYSPPPSPVQAEPQDLQVVEVSVNKANLRVGPGLNHSPLMTVAQGTRLVVETEKDKWYRIIAPNGVRLWVSSDVVISLT